MPKPIQRFNPPELFDSLSEQAELVVKNLQTCLDSVNATKYELLMIRVYPVNLNEARLGEVFPSIAGFFRDVNSAFTGIGVQALFAPDLQIEVEMIARVNPTREQLGDH